MHLNSSPGRWFHFLFNVSVRCRRYVDLSLHTYLANIICYEIFDPWKIIRGAVLRSSRQEEYITGKSLWKAMLVTFSAGWPCPCSRIRQHIATRYSARDDVTKRSRRASLISDRSGRLSAARSSDDVNQGKLLSVIWYRLSLQHHADIPPIINILCLRSDVILTVMYIR